MRNVFRNLMCALGLAGSTIAAPAGATVIASFSYPSFGVSFGGFGDAQVFAPLFSVLVNGAPDFSAVPADGSNIFVLSGSALTTMAAELSDGSTDSYEFDLVLDSVNDAFGLGLSINELNFTGAGNLPGASIQGIRISVASLCMQPTTAGGCVLIGQDHVGFSSNILVEISDVPFRGDTPEPATLALLALGLAGLGFSRRKH